MTPEEQIKAIAEYRSDSPRERLIHYNPEYLRDLNLVHEKEKQIGARRYDAKESPTLWDKYVQSVCWVSERDNTSTIHANPSQRCEALLRVIGCWRDKPKQ